MTDDVAREADMYMVILFELLHSIALHCIGMKYTSIHNEQKTFSTVKISNS